jgi:hypothetical protein
VITGGGSRVEAVQEEDGAALTVPFAAGCA